MVRHNVDMRETIVFCVVIVVAWLAQMTDGNDAKNNAADSTRVGGVVDVLVMLQDVHQWFYTAVTEVDVIMVDGRELALARFLAN